MRLMVCRGRRKELVWPGVQGNTLVEGFAKGNLGQEETIYRALL